eukprot:9497870-Pyramimonas_sp.AAC.1
MDARSPSCRRVQQVDALGESTSGDWNIENKDKSKKNSSANTGLSMAKDILARFKATTPSDCPERGVFCSRTVNLRSISTFAYDMDYTLVAYDVQAWEGRAYQYGIEKLREWRWPVEGLSFDPDLVRSKMSPINRPSPLHVTDERLCGHSIRQCCRFERHLHRHTTRGFA